ncbi:MAG: hypothetical protein ACK5MW_03270 [Enterococcus sp.]
MTNQQKNSQSELKTDSSNTTEEKVAVKKDRIVRKGAYTPEDNPYYQMKTNDHDEVVGLIQAAEIELADLKLRKALMESDFNELLTSYKGLIVPNVEISAIAKKTLLEYFTYELLRPLTSIGLKPSELGYDIWENKHFLTTYQLNEDNDLELSFKLNPLEQRFTTEFMPFIAISPETMEVKIADDQALELIRLWHTDHVFSRNQLSLVNYDINQLLNHFRELGFTVHPSLFDNTQPLNVALESEFSMETQVLDEIFITTMENPEYDFEKTGQDAYQVLLDQEQKMDIRKKENDHTMLLIDSENRKRSILDFFTNYPFLVPLMVR